MPSLKEVRNRIKSVGSTQQITRAMKMVAAAKLRRAQDAAIQMRPYSAKINGILKNLTAGSEVMAENVYARSRGNEKVLLVVITSDRGLCGPFNTNVLKAVNNLLIGKYAVQHNAKNVSFLCLGKKGLDLLTKRYPQVNGDFATIFQQLNFERVKEIAEYCMEAFVSGRYDVIEVVYNEFKNVATQVLRVETFLPIPASDSSEVSEGNIDYIFEPSVDFIINDLVPRSLKVKMYKSVLESFASEHGARMTAMDKATENAGELLKELKITYNRSRQASITKEILEIVGGAEALGG